MCFSLSMLSLCKPEQYYQIFLAQGVAVGLGAGAAYVPSVIISHYFRKRRALAMAIVTTRSAHGAVLHPVMRSNTLRSHLNRFCTPQDLKAARYSSILNACY
ncbi:hypothetical protein FB451DRAFT_1413078 [Mycena latifolia]|nr:hypothetical protein FB451DRAFT_1413078 [Mycena latifolia]